MDRDRIANDLWAAGFASMGKLVDATACARLRSGYNDENAFRSTVDMSRYRFGEGQYRYFAYPLPPLVQDLRERIYAMLAPLATDWMATLGLPRCYPETLDDFLAECRAAGQTRPTPLLLRYGEGSYNCLHQDLYGDVVFPFQVVVGLSDPGTDYDGGELLLVEQRPRAQSVGRVLRPAPGEGFVITTRYRPVKGARGFYRANIRHGVSLVTRGERFTLGIIFHDAE